MFTMRTRRGTRFDPLLPTMIATRATVAGHPGVGAAKHVVDDRHPVHSSDEVELRRAEPVHAERVPFDEQPVPRPEGHQVLVPAALAVHAAGQRALEAIPAQRQVVAEEAVDEVAAAAVVEPVVDDRGCVSSRA